MPQTPNGYNTSDGQFVDSRDVVLHPSATRTATGNGTVVEETGKRRVASLTLTVAARSGTTPTLDVTVQTSRDGSTWYTAGSFAQATAAGAERKTFALDRFVRARWVLGGTTPSFTFSLDGELV
jgi:hypothetical protein